MIKSNIALLYDARDGQKWGIVLIEINEWFVTHGGITYTVMDYAVDGDTREFIGSKEVFRSWDQLNSINEYLEATYNYSGMTKKDREFSKVKHGLLIDTQTKPVYGSTPQDWVLIEEV